MSIDEYAAFWRARDAAQLVGINYDDQQKTVTIVVSAAEAVDGLTLRVDPSVTSVLAPTTVKLILASGGNFVVLPPLEAGGMAKVTLGYM